MSIISSIKQIAGKIFKSSSEGARQDAQTALDDAKAELAKIDPLLGQFKTDIENAISTADSRVQSTVDDIVKKLLEDASNLLHGGSNGNK